MSLMMNLVMLGCTYPILFFLYFFMKLEIGDKKKTLLGIAVPEEFRQEPQVQEICRLFRRDMKRGLAVMIVFPAVFFWAPWFTWYITGYLLWVYLMMAVEFVPMIRYGEQLKTLKRRMGWGGWNSGTEVDFSIALQPVHVVKKWLLALLFFLSLPPVLWELIFRKSGAGTWDYVVILTAMAAVVWCFCVMLVRLDRQKSELISRDGEVNLAFNRSKKRLRAVAWTWTAALSVVLVWGDGVYRS